MAKCVGTIPISPFPKIILEYQLHIVRNRQKFTPTLIQGGGGCYSLTVKLSSSWIDVIQSPSSQLLTMIVVTNDVIMSSSLYMFVFYFRNFLQRTREYPVWQFHPSP